MDAYRGMLRNRPFAALWAGSTVSALGDAMTWVSLIWIVYSLTGSVQDVSVLVVVFTLPVVAGGLVMGPILDRYDKRIVLMTVNAALGTAVATIPLMAHAGALNVWHLWLVAALYGLLKMANLAGVPALLPALVEDEQLNTANAMESISYWISDAGGPALAGLLIGLVGGPNVLVFDVASYVLFVALLTQVRTPAGSAAPVAAEEKTSIGLKPALGFVRESRPILALTIMFMAFNVGEGMLFVLLPVHAKTALGGSASAYGWLLSSLALAALGTSTVVGSIKWKWSLGRSIAATQTVAGLAALGFGARPGLASSIVTLAVLGGLTAPLTIWAQTVRMRLIPQQIRGRVFGILRTAMQATPPLGAAIAGLFLTRANGWTLAVVFLSICMSVPGLFGLMIPALSARDVTGPVEPADEQTSDAGGGGHRTVIS